MKQVFFITDEDFIKENIFICHLNKICIKKERKNKRQKANLKSNIKSE